MGAFVASQTPADGVFFKSIANSTSFISLLPADWLVALRSYLPLVENNAQAYGLYQAGELVAGGVVFLEELKESTSFEKEHAPYMFKACGPYIGFVWVLPERRGEQLGSLWFNELFKTFPNQGFWLSIEEAGLKTFYEKIGFKVFDTHIENGNFLEQILFYNPKQ